MLPPAAQTVPPGVRPLAVPIMLPPALAERLGGATVEGVVTGRDGAGRVLLRTEAGTLALVTRIALPRGARVTLRIEAGAPVSAIIETIDGAPPPSSPPPAASRGAPTAAPATTGAAGESDAREGGPAPVLEDRAPVSRSAPSSPAGARAVVAGAVVTATPIARPAGPPPSPPNMPQTQGSQPAPNAPLSDAKPPAAPESGAAAPRPTPSEAGGQRSPAASATAGAQARKAPLTLRVLAIAPAPADPPQTPLSSPSSAEPSAQSAAPPPGPAADQAASPAKKTDGPRIPRPVYARAPATGRPNGQATGAEAAPKGQTAAGLPPAPSAPSAAALSPARALASMPAVPGTAAAPRAAPPTAAPLGNDGIAPAAFTASVIGADASGRPLIETPMGVLRLELAQPLAAGARLLLVPVEVDPPADPASVDALPAALLGPTREWPALRAALDGLRAIAPAEARAVIERAIPQPGPRLAQVALFFLAALRGGDLAGWFGQEPLKRLGDHGQGDLVRRLASDFAQLGRIGQQNPTPQSAHWQATMIPILSGETVERVRLFHRRSGGEDGADRNGTGTRFVVEFGLSRLGEVQLDGFLRARRFDLILRSRAALSEEMRRDIAAIFENGLAIAGLGGALAFQVAERFPVSPLAEMRAHAEDGDGLVV